MEGITENRVIRYWSARVHDFGQVRKSELSDRLGQRWCAALEQLLPSGKLRILDAGTGTGYFSILLARRGHKMTGIDLTHAMIAEAKTQAETEGLPIRFEVMDAQALSFANESFDAVISRNLTWTLPDPETAYREWFRVLKKDGVLINFDANYGKSVSTGMPQKTGPGDAAPYGHAGVTPEMMTENKEITLSMDISRENRPEWDLAALQRTGFSSFAANIHAGTAILRERDDPAAPVFLVTAKK